MVLPILSLVLAAKCAMPHIVVGESPDKRLKVSADWPGHTVTWTNAGKKVLSLKWEPLGHHPQVLVADNGLVAIVDGYAGIQLFDLKKRQVSATDVELLKGIPASKRLHKWTCHAEGEWLDRSAKPKVSTDSVEVKNCVGGWVKLSIR